ncbi:hypothetical protein ACVIRO_002373 [Rhizobium ruizarguesonis]
MKWIVSKLAPRLISIADRRDADIYIGGREDTYLARWYLIPRNKWFNVYLHHFQRSDDDRALHDHPWWNLSVLLRGSYTEQTINAGGVNVLAIRSAGDFKFRYASEAHRIELHDGPCWTLFITGPRIREWGFHCPKGWRHWKVFTNPADNGATIGLGCGEYDGDVKP